MSQKERKEGQKEGRKEGRKGGRKKIKQALHTTVSVCDGLRITAVHHIV